MKKLLTLILASTAFAAMADDTAAGGVTTTTTPANQVTTTTATPTSTGDNSIVNGDGSGLYVGVGVGMGWNNQSFPTTTFRLDGGYNFNQFWAFEVGIITLTQSGGPFNQNVDIYDASIKGT